MTVGIYGLGRFGSFWSTVLTKRFAVCAYDIDDDRMTPDGIERVSLKELGACPVIFLCVSIRAVPQALQSLLPYLGPDSMIADTCSVKVLPSQWMKKILPKTVSLLATHPMFGPESAKNGLDGLSIMMDPLRLDDKKLVFWEDVFVSLGLSPVIMDCDRHDREAAYSQALTHFVGRTLSGIGIPETSIATRWYQKLQAVSKQCVRDSHILFEDMQLYNPYAAEMRSKLIKALLQTNSYLEQCEIELGADNKSYLEV